MSDLSVNPATANDPVPAQTRQTERLGKLIFIITFFAFAYFHPGSDGHNAARFAMTRAMVEEGRFTIDSYLVYSQRLDEEDSRRLARHPLRDAVFEGNGVEYIFCWAKSGDENFALVPFNTTQKDVERFVDILLVSATLDVSYSQGHFHPNKAPGPSFLAVPAYFVIYHVERLLGFEPDEWWTLTVNAWLTSVLSVGLISALGCVVFFRLALMFSEGDLMASLLATLSLALGTMYFIYATCQYEYNVAGVGLLAAFWMLWRVKERGGGDEVVARRNAVELSLAGVAAGWAAISNYIAAVGVVMLGIYLLRSVRVKRGWLWFGLGLLGPLVLVLFYNWSCFGMPLTTNYRDQAAFQKFEGAFLGVFRLPQWDVLLAILFSPFRGMFFFYPVLAMGVLGGVRLWRQGRWRAELAVCAGIVLAYLLFNICYVGWFGGAAVAPRYFTPAVAFLALPLAVAFAHWRKTTKALAVYSVAVSLLIVAVNPFSTLGVHLMTLREGIPLWRHNQLTDYLLPLFFTGGIEPLISERIERRVADNDRLLVEAGYSEEVRRASADLKREQLRRDIETMENYWYALLIGEHISANQTGIYEMLPCRLFNKDSEAPRWNSFNVGEFLFPQSRWSLLPFALICATLIASAFWSARRAVTSNSEQSQSS